MAQRKKYPKKKKYPNSSIERRLQFYPAPKYFSLFKAYITANEMGETEAGRLIIRTFFDSMPEVEILRIQRLAAERSL
jgi:hypothetical protein